MNIRSARDTDTNFILATWLRSYYESLKYYGSGDRRAPYPRDDVFFQGHQEKIKELLPKAECLVCTAPDEDNQILGWIVFDERAIHYLYVKQPFRKFGIAKRLLAKVPVKTYTHHTTHSKYLNKGLVYDPYKF